MATRNKFPDHQLTQIKQNVKMMVFQNMTLESDTQINICLNLLLGGVE